MLLWSYLNMSRDCDCIWLFFHFKLGNFRKFSILVKFSEFNPLKLVFWSLDAGEKVSLRRFHPSEVVKPGNINERKTLQLFQSSERKRKKWTWGRMEGVGQNLVGENAFLGAPPSSCSFLKFSSTWKATYFQKLEGEGYGERSWCPMRRKGEMKQGNLRVMVGKGYWICRQHFCKNPWGF